MVGSRNNKHLSCAVPRGCARLYRLHNARCCRRLHPLPPRDRLSPSPRRLRKGCRGALGTGLRRLVWSALCRPPGRPSGWVRVWARPVQRPSVSLYPVRRWNLSPVSGARPVCPARLHRLSSAGPQEKSCGKCCGKSLPGFLRSRRLRCKPTISPCQGTSSPLVPAHTSPARTRRLTRAVGATVDPPHRFASGADQSAGRSAHNRHAPAPGERPTARIRRKPTRKHICVGQTYPRPERRGCTTTAGARAMGGIDAAGAGDGWGLSPGRAATVYSAHCQRCAGQYSCPHGHNQG